jgi:hypothetical protein
MKTLLVKASNVTVSGRKNTVTSKEPYKIYRSLPEEEKIKCLIKEEDIQQID